MPVLEAMACGVPVVASSHASLDEACGDAAVRADPRDSDAMADAIAAGTRRDETSSCRAASPTRTRSPGSTTARHISRRGSRRSERRRRRDAAEADPSRHRALSPQPPRADRRGRAGRIRRRRSGVRARTRALVVSVPAFGASRAGRPALSDVLRAGAPACADRGHGARPCGLSLPGRVSALDAHLRATGVATCAARRVAGDRGLRVHRIRARDAPERPAREDLRGAERRRRHLHRGGTARGGRLSARRRDARTTEEPRPCRRGSGSDRS